MDRWKSRGEKSQRGEAKKWEDQSRERVRRKKTQVREKVGKSRFTVFFQWFVAPEGRKVGSLKRRVRSHLARWEMKKLHAVVARSTLPSQKCKNTDSPGPLSEVEMSKKCTPLWREAHFQIKMVESWRVRTTFAEVEMSKVCTLLWREAHFQVKVVKSWRVRTTFGSWDVEKVHAVVARSTFGSQSVKRVWAFFDVQMPKKCTPTNLTNLTHLTNRNRLTHFTNLTN